MLHSYSKLPAVENTLASVAFCTPTAMLFGAPVIVWKMTVCAVAPNSHVTVPPTRTATSGGENWRFVPATTRAVAGGGGSVISSLQALTSGTKSKADKRRLHPPGSRKRRRKGGRAIKSIIGPATAAR